MDTHVDTTIPDIVSEQVMENLTIESRVINKKTSRYHTQIIPQPEDCDVLTHHDEPSVTAIMPVEKTDIVVNEAIIPEKTTSDTPEEQKSARRGWWRNRFGL